MDPYRPIACALHDQYLAWTTERRIVVVHHRDGTGVDNTLTDRIKDVYTRADATEWMVMASGTEIRLDRIHRVEPA